MNTLIEAMNKKTDVYTKLIKKMKIKIPKRLKDNFKSHHAIAEDCDALVAARR